MSHPSPLVIVMSYAELRPAFDALALEIFDRGYRMTGSERLSRVQELHGLALQVLAAAKGRHDSVKAIAHVSSIVQRANSMTTAATQAELLRERFARARLGQPVCF